MENKPLTLKDQLCFPLYVCAKEIVRRYSPCLEPLGLTYTQYIVMMVLWEKREITVKNLGTTLYLDSGTLTPLLKKLEAKGFIARRRSREDERSVIISLTPQGSALEEAAAPIPEQVSLCVNFPPEEAARLRESLRSLLAMIREDSDGQEP